MACGITVVVAAQNRADAEDRQEAADEQLSDASDLEALRAEVDSQAATQAELDARAEALAALFTPDVLAAVVQVQTEAVPAACDSARSATRDAAALPTGDSVTVYAVATAPATHQVLDGLPDRWGRMLNPMQVQTEIDRCAADEQAVIDAEAAAAAAADAAAQRNCGVPLFPDDYCPTQAEIDAENQAEGLCGGGHYDQAAALGIIC